MVTIILDTLFTVIRQMAKIITVSCKSHQLIDTLILTLLLTRWLIFQIRLVAFLSILLSPMNNNLNEPMTRNIFCINI